MPTFRYRALDKNGRRHSGVLPARDEAALELKLKPLGLWLMEASREKGAVPAARVSRLEELGQRLRRKRQRRELIEFCTLMSFQTQVGVPLVQALESVNLGCRNEAFRKVLHGLIIHVESGEQFSEALEHYPHVFTPHFISVVRAGELSSKLPEVFQELKEYHEWIEQMLGDVRQATLYPAILVTAMGCFSLFLFTCIIPKFANLLDKLHVQQPLLTQLVFTAGDVVRHTWWVWLPLLLQALVAVPLLQRFSPKAALAIDEAKLHVPVFGQLNRMLALSRFAHNLAILYRAGLPILRALQLCTQGLIGNRFIEQAVIEVEANVRGGSTIGEAMRRQSAFPAILLRMVAMGEATGNLDRALEDVTKYYNQIIPRRIKSIFAVLEPALMVFLIFLVGVVALAIYLPIISLMGGIK